MKNEEMLDILDQIDEDILERNTKKRCNLWAKVTASQHKGGKSKNVAIIVLAATLALTLVAFGAFIILSQTDDPTPSNPTESIVSIEKTSQNGDTVIYTITYKNGKTATLDVTDKAPDGSGAKVTGVSFDENSNIYLSLATGKLLNMGRAVGKSADNTLQRANGMVTLSVHHFVLLDNSTDATTVAGVEVDEEENMSYYLDNGKHLALGQVHKKGEGDEDTSMSMACINEAGELVIGFASGETMNLGRVVGKDGKDGVGIEGINLSDAGELSVTLTNGTVLNLGNVKGQDGIGIAESKINDAGELVLTYTDGNSVNLGRVVGEKGEDGVGIGSININDAGELTIVLTDGTNLNLGNIKGQDGKSAYELYKEKYGYEGTEEEWLYDLVNGNLATKVKYPVTFDSAGGSEVPTQEIEEGGKVIEPTTTRAGYTFAGWYLGEELWSFAGYSITEPITLTAKWEIITYKITYKDVYPSDKTVGEATYTVEDEITVKNLAYYMGDDGNSLEGRTFLGWTYGDITTPTKDLVIPKGTTGDLTVTAHWDVQEKFQFTTAPFKNSCLTTTWVGDYRYLVMDGADVYAVCDGSIKSVKQQSDGKYDLTLTLDYDPSGKTTVTYHGIGTLSPSITQDAHVSAGDVLGQAKNTGAGFGTAITLSNTLAEWPSLGGNGAVALYRFFPGGSSAWESAVSSSAYKDAVLLPAQEGDSLAWAEATYHDDDGYVTLKYAGNEGDPRDPSYTLGNTWPNLQGKQYLVIKYRTTSECNGAIIFMNATGAPHFEDVDWENTGEWTYAFIDVSNIAQVQEANQTWFRIDFFDDSCNSTDTFDLAYACFFDSLASAEAFVADFG